MTDWLPNVTVHIWNDDTHEMVICSIGKEVHIQEDVQGIPDAIFLVSGPRH